MFVADSHTNKVISINGNIGEYINEKHMLGPGCLMAAPFSASPMSVILLSHDHSQEMILLSAPNDIVWWPLSIMAYDFSYHQLIISCTDYVGNYKQLLSKIILDSDFCQNYLHIPVGLT